MLNFKDLLDYAQAEAISCAFEGTELSVWRAICRSYSVKFSTPLHLLTDGTVNPEDILLNVFESQLENADLEKDCESLLEKIRILENPLYEKEKEADLDAFVKKVQEEERERIKKGEPVRGPTSVSTESMDGKVDNKNTSEKEPIQEPPKSGGLDMSKFSHLADEES